MELCAGCCICNALKLAMPMLPASLQLFTGPASSQRIFTFLCTDCPETEPLTTCPCMHLQFLLSTSASCAYRRSCWTTARGSTCGVALPPSSSGELLPSHSTASNQHVNFQLHALQPQTVTFIVPVYPVIPCREADVHCSWEDCLPLLSCTTHNQHCSHLSFVSCRSVTHKKFQTLGPLVPGSRAAFPDKVKVSSHRCLCQSWNSLGRMEQICMGIPGMIASWRMWKLFSARVPVLVVAV
jgi:hypothetical protein